eukprot:75824-Chlamydomonas_euryale.AAC.3
MSSPVAEASLTLADPRRVHMDVVGFALGSYRSCSISTLVKACTLSGPPQPHTCRCPEQPRPCTARDTRPAVALPALSALRRCMARLNVSMPGRLRPAYPFSAFLGTRPSPPPAHQSFSTTHTPARPHHPHRPFPIQQPYLIARTP